MSSFKKKYIYYFEYEGKENFGETIKIVNEFIKSSNVSNIIVFTVNGESALQAFQAITKDGIHFVAVSYPPSKEVEDDRGNVTRLGITDKKILAELKKANIQIAQGSMPFREILLFPLPIQERTIAIKSTLKLFGGALDLCVEAALMACDQGYVDEGEKAVSVCGDTAIVATVSRSELMFSPIGFEINEIICKPGNLNLSRPRSSISEE